jgi:hypothetical protein
VQEYISKPINQKAKLPTYIDASLVNKEFIRPLKKKLKTADTVIGAVSVVVIVLLFIEVTFISDRRLERHLFRPEPEKHFK